MKASITNARSANCIDAVLLICARLKSTLYCPAQILAQRQRVNWKFQSSSWTPDALAASSPLSAPSWM